jgi:FAE1/Type III polyketide synthase-like protein
MSVLGVYLPILWFVVVGILSVQVVRTLYDHRFDVSAFLSSEISVIELQKPVAFDLGWKSMAILALVIWYLNHRDKPVYLIDFAVFEPPEDWKLSHDQLMDIMGKQGCFTEDSLNFLSRFVSVSLFVCRAVCLCGPTLYLLSSFKVFHIFVRRFLLFFYLFFMY